MEDCLCSTGLELSRILAFAGKRSDQEVTARWRRGHSGSRGAVENGDLPSLDELNVDNEHEDHPRLRAAAKHAASAQTMGRMSLRVHAPIPTLSPE